jgi:general stress protein 26
MTHDDPARPLDQLIEPGTTLMVGTTTAQRLEFRPLTAARVEGDRIDILLDTNEEWVRSFTDGDEIHATVSDTRENVWVALHGNASITRDEALIDELWNPFAAAYFDNGRDTPGIAVLRVTADDGRYWTTTSGRIGSLVSMIKAKLGSPDDSGQHGDVAL